MAALPTAAAAATAAATTSPYCQPITISLPVFYYSCETKNQSMAEENHPKRITISGEAAAVYWNTK